MCAPFADEFMIMRNEKVCPERIDHSTRLEAILSQSQLTLPVSWTDWRKSSSLTEGQIHDKYSVVGINLALFKIGVVLKDRIHSEIATDIALLSGKFFPVAWKFRTITCPDKTGEAIRFHDVHISVKFSFGKRADNSNGVHFKTVEISL